MENISCAYVANLNLRQIEMHVETCDRVWKIKTDWNKIVHKDLKEKHH